MLLDNAACDIKSQMPIYVWVRPDEMKAIQGRMAEAGISNLSAYVRKMALNGYVDRKSTRLNSSHIPLSRMPSSA